MRTPATALALGAALIISSASNANAAAGRGYELVSFPEAAADVGLGSLAETGHTLAPHWSPVAPNGSVLLGTSVPVTGEPSGVASSQWIATRSTSGWTRTYVGMPVNRNAFDGSQQPLTFSADLRSSAWFATSQTGTDRADPTPIITDPPNSQYWSLLLRTASGLAREQFTGGTVVGPAFPSANAELSADGSTLTFAATGLTLPPATSPSQVYQRSGSTLRVLGYDAQGRELASAQLVATNASGTRVLLSGTDVDGNAGLYLWSGGANTRAIPAGSSGVAVAVDSDLRTATVITREPLAAADTDTSADLYDVDLTTGASTLLTAGDTSSGNTSDPTTCVAPLPQSQVGGGFVADCDVAWFGGRPGQITYFESPEVLDGAAGAIAGDPNVYYARGGQVHFAFRLDAAGAASGPDTILQASRRYTVDPSGAIDFTAPLVAGSTTDASGLSQAQRFDPAAGSVVCLTCASTGATTSAGELQPAQIGFPGTPGTDVTDNGELVYVTTAQQLSPADTNRAKDVYEYDVRTRTRTLITPGSQDLDSSFVGVSPDGTDVFFATQQRLVSADRNGGVWKIYDARRGGGFPESPTDVPCQGDACRPAAPAPPAPGPIATAAVTTQPTPDPDANDSDLALVTPTLKARKGVARTGSLHVTIKGAAIGEHLHVKLSIGKATYASTNTTAHRSTATATLRLTAARRRALKKLTRGKAVSATLTVESLGSDAGDDAALTLPKSTGSAR